MSTLVKPTSEQPSLNSAVEVSPEMLEAGRKAYSQYYLRLSDETGFFGPEDPVPDMLADVFRAMTRARP